jgi:hypothetical protein
MEAPTPVPTVTDRMARGRRRVVAGAAAVFLAAWIAVIGLGQHAHAAGQATPAGAAVAPGGPGGPGGSGAAGEDGGWFDGGDAGGAQAGGQLDGTQPGPTSEAPLTTRQS